MPFNLADYEPVEERLARFWKDHPNGRVHTELINGSDHGEYVVMSASVYKDKADLYPDAVGHAQETRGEGMVNKTSWIENCETSAIGRALANMGYAPKGKRPSREEMAKVSKPPQRAERNASPTPAAAPLTKQQKRIVIAATQAGIDDTLRHRITRMLTGFTSAKDVLDEDCERVAQNIAWFKENPDMAMKELAAWEVGNKAPLLVAP